MSDAVSTGTRLSPLAHPYFRYFFIGQVVNRFGGSMAGVALAFAVLEIDDSASALGWVVAASSIPMVVLMLLGGAIADRLPRAVVIDGFFSFVALPIGQVAVGPLAHAFGPSSVELGFFVVAVLVACFALTRRVLTDLTLTGAPPPELTSDAARP